MITIFNTLNFKVSSLKKCTISIALCAAISALNGADVNLEGVSVEDSADDGYRATTSEVGKTNTPILEIPQTVNVVTAQQLKDKKPETLAESLQNVSGVSYANSTRGIFDAVLKRGFGKNRDGSIMRNGTSAGVRHSFNATVQTVEVLKGPASLLYGVQDPGGIINRFTTLAMKFTLALATTTTTTMALIAPDLSEKVALHIDLFSIKAANTTGENMVNLNPC